ncbi:hypothetical protein Taro_021747, partial [Colocasia esculenta]|nr:hypothetical protein [Colocasia esculenta]
DSPFAAPPSRQWSPSTAASPPSGLPSLQLHLHASDPPSPSATAPPPLGEPPPRRWSGIPLYSSAVGTPPLPPPLTGTSHLSTSPVWPTASFLPLPPPQLQVHLHRLHHLEEGALVVEGRLGELQRGGYLMDNNGMSPSSEDTAWALLHTTLRVTWALYQKCIETMTQMIAPSSDVDAESQTPATPKDAFISVMGKDRHSRVRCAGSGETLSTWYKSTGMSGSSERERIMQEQLKVQEEKLKAQAEEMTQMREKISRLENVAMKVDEMSILLSQIQASQARTQHVPPAVQSESDSKTDEAADDYSDHDDHVS